MVEVNHFLASELDKVRAIKRGGNVTFIELDALAPEDRYRHEPTTNQSPERLYDRGWAVAVLERVLGRLRLEFGGAERSIWY